MAFLKSGLWTLAHEISDHEDSPPVYFYSFEYESENSLFEWMFGPNMEEVIPGGEQLV